MQFAGYSIAMTSIWTNHQFVSGAVALDLVNTVCYRNDLERRFDKLEAVGDINDFAHAAHRFATDMPVVAAPIASDANARLWLDRIATVREAVHAAFSPDGGRTRDEAIADLIERFAQAGRRLGFKNGVGGPALALSDGADIDLIILDSGIRLLFRADAAPIKRCPRCHWLLVDRSKNRSRTWCDMRSCGNVAKARRYQARRHKP